MQTTIRETLTQRVMENLEQGNVNEELENTLKSNGYEVSRQGLGEYLDYNLDTLHYWLEEELHRVGEQIEAEQFDFHPSYYGRQLQVTSIEQMGELMEELAQSENFLIELHGTLKSLGLGSMRYSTLTDIGNQVSFQV